MGKIVNAHVHFGIPWGPSPHLDVSYTPETLLRDMDRDGVDMSIILPFIFNYDMQWHARCAREHPDRLIAYAMFNPWRHPTLKDDIRRWRDWGIRGIKLRASNEGFNLNSFDLLTDCFEVCQELTTMVDFSPEQAWISDMVNNILIEVLGTMAQQERETIRKRQREGIDAAKAKGKHMGRPSMQKPENWDQVYGTWKNGEITAKKAQELLGLKSTTFYNLVRVEAQG